MLGVKTGIQAVGRALPCCLANWAFFYIDAKSAAKPIDKGKKWENIDCIARRVGSEYRQAFQVVQTFPGERKERG